MKPSMPIKCPKCHKLLLQATGESFSRQNQKSTPFRLGRVCIGCEIIYLNPYFSCCTIISDSGVGE